MCACTCRIARRSESSDETGSDPEEFEEAHLRSSERRQQVALAMWVSSQPHTHHVCNKS